MGLRIAFGMHGVVVLMLAVVVGMHGASAMEEPPVRSYDEITSPSSGMCAGFVGADRRRLLNHEEVIGGGAILDKTFAQCQAECDGYSVDGNACQGFSWGTMASPSPPPPSPPPPVVYHSDRRRQLLQDSGNEGLGDCYMFSSKPTSTVGSSYNDAVCYAVGTCSNSDGITGYDFSHNGYFLRPTNSPDPIEMGSVLTNQACADECNMNPSCVAFERNEDPNAMIFNSCVMYAAIIDQAHQEGFSAYRRCQGGGGYGAPTPNAPEGDAIWPECTSTCGDLVTCQMMAADLATGCLRSCVDADKVELRMTLRAVGMDELADCAVLNTGLGQACSSAIDLSTISSPYTGSTVSSPNFLTGTSSCAAHPAPDLVFTYFLPPGGTISLQQTWNDYDSYHELRYGESCPGSNVIQCIDDSDLTAVTWTNTESTVQQIFYVQSGYSAGEGIFTLTWNVLGATTGAPTASPPGISKVSLSVEFSATLPTNFADRQASFRILYKSQVATAASVMVEAVTIEDIRAGARNPDMQLDTFIVVSTVKFQDDGICTKAKKFVSTLNYTEHEVDLFPLQNFNQYGEVTVVADLTCEPMSDDDDDGDDDDDDK